MPYDEVMPKFAAGTLRSGSGQKVTSRAQAIAIEESEKKKAAAGNTEYAASGSRGERAARRALARQK